MSKQPPMTNLISPFGKSLTLFLPYFIVPILLYLFFTSPRLTNLVTPFVKTTPYDESHNPFWEKPHLIFYLYFIVPIFYLASFDKSRNPFVKTTPYDESHNPFWEKPHLTFLTNFVIPLGRKTLKIARCWKSWIKNLNKS